MGMLVTGSTISPLIVISISMRRPTLRAAVSRLHADGRRRDRLPQTPRRRRARCVTVARTCPSHSASPGKLTTVLPVGAPGQLPRRAAGSSCRPAPPPCVPTDRCVQFGLDVPLQRLQRHDAARLLRPRLRRRPSACAASVFGRGEYLNENMLWNRTARSATASRRSPPPVSPGNPTIMSVESWMPGMAVAQRVDQLEIFLARVAPAHRLEHPRRARTAPAGAGACIPWAGRASLDERGRCSAADAGWQSGCARRRAPRGRPRAGRRSRRPGRRAPGSD